MLSIEVASGLSKIVSNKFYLDYRMGVGYARSSLEDPIPSSLSSMEAWEDKKSTKFDICARMCRHLLSNDDAPPMKFDDGKVVFPEASSQSEKCTQTNKIVIYQEFPSLSPLLRAVRAPWRACSQDLFLAGSPTIRSPKLCNKWQYDIRKTSIDNRQLQEVDDLPNPCHVFGWIHRA